MASNMSLTGKAPSIAGRKASLPLGRPARGVKSQNHEAEAEREGPSATLGPSGHGSSSASAQVLAQ